MQQPAAPRLPQLNPPRSPQFAAHRPPADLCLTASELGRARRGGLRQARRWRQLQAALRAVVCWIRSGLLVPGVRAATDWGRRFRLRRAVSCRQLGAASGCSGRDATGFGWRTAPARRFGLLPTRPTQCCGLRPLRLRAAAAVSCGPYGTAGRRGTALRPAQLDLLWLAHPCGLRQAARCALCLWVTVGWRGADCSVLLNHAEIAGIFF